MADVKYVVTVDSTGAHKAIETLDQALAKLKGETKDTGAATEDLGKKSESLWQQFAIGQMVVNAARQAWRLFKGQVTEVIGAAAAAEKVDRSLDASLAITGREVQALSKHFKEYATELMNLTVYDDEAIKSSQALLVQLTDLDQRGIDRATKGAIGLASVFGMDLVSASTLVAKAMAGNMAALSRYGIKVDENLSLEQKRVVLLDKLEKMFGRATTDADVYSGRVTQLKNVWGEAQEEIGKAVTQNEKVAGTFKAIRDTIVLITPDLKAMLKDVSTFVLDVAKAAMDAIAWIKKVKDTIGDSSGEVSAADVAWDNLSKRMGGFTDVARAVIAQLNRTQQYAKDNSDVNRQLWESYNTVGERATLAAIAAGKFGPETAKAFEIVGGEGLKVALAAAKAEENITDLGGAAAAAAPQMTLLNTAIDAMPWGKHRAELLAAEKWLRSTATLIETQIPTVAGYSSNIDEAARHVEILRRALEGLNKVPQTWQDKLTQTMSTIALVESTLIGQADAVFSQAQRNKEIAIDNEYKKRLDSINRNIKDEAARQKAIIALEAEFQIKKTAAQAAGAKQQKAISLAGAVMNTAQAITAMLTMKPAGPWNFAFAAMAGAMGALQVALIAKQPIPLARGAVFTKPTLLPATTYQVAEAGEPEIVSPKSTIRDAVREAFTSMPQMALAGAGGATVNLYITGPLVTTSGLSDSDLLQAKDKLVKYVNEGLRGTGRKQL